MHSKTPVGLVIMWAAVILLSFTLSGCLTSALGSAAGGIVGATATATATKVLQSKPEPKPVEDPVPERIIKLPAWALLYLLSAQNQTAPDVQGEQKEVQEEVKPEAPEEAEIIEEDLSPWE